MDIIRCINTIAINSQLALENADCMLFEEVSFSIIFLAYVSYDSRDLDGRYPIHHVICESFMCTEIILYRSEFLAPAHRITSPENQFACAKCPKPMCARVPNNFHWQIQTCSRGLDQYLYQDSQTILGQTIQQISRVKIRLSSISWWANLFTFVEGFPLQLYFQ